MEASTKKTRKTIIKGRSFPQIAYRKTGKGPVLVLLHGFPENGDLWNKVEPELSEKFTLIIPDLPGSGDSVLAEAQTSMDELAGAVKEILDTEGVKKLVLAGHSMGGYTALAFAEKYPGILKGLSMVHSLATADNEEKKENRRKAISVIQKGGRETFIKQMIPGLFSADFKNNQADELKRQVDTGLKLPAGSIVAFYNAMINRPDRSGILTTAKYPVQWIIGKEDTIASPEVVLKQSTLSGVNFVSVYEDCAHMSMIEQPELLIQDLGRFVQYCFDKQD